MVPTPKIHTPLNVSLTKCDVVSLNGHKHNLVPGFSRENCPEGRGGGGGGGGGGKTGALWGGGGGGGGGRRGLKTSAILARVCRVVWEHPPPEYVEI